MSETWDISGGIYEHVRIGIMGGKANVSGWGRGSKSPGIKVQVADGQWELGNVQVEK